MKRMEVTEKKIGDSVFYIRPFPAFTSANISGELASALAPFLKGLSSVAGKAEGGESSEKVADILNENIDDVLPAISDAFSSLSGEKLESLMKKLLIIHKNISVESEVTDGAVVSLTQDLADEIFCGEIQDMFLLCFEVIKINFGGFFKKFGLQSGDQNESTETKTG